MSQFFKGLSTKISSLLDHQLQKHGKSLIGSSSCADKIRTRRGSLNSAQWSDSEISGERRQTYRMVVLYRRPPSSTGRHS
ncbi:hypothetical protein Hypma_014057 [Hypsizygus marmoreus]|uniref:Uncharacterized protein n=1 Tax=Hypsizygus marmoreus TaxID=39966 RepID=A0A369KB88_HYPMA|nr:hypothetical protein Hypma_014057 [Hypsizygus marmoreus]